MTTDIAVSVSVEAPRPEVWRALTVDVGLRPWWWAHAGDTTFDLPQGVNGRYRIASRNLDVAVTGWLLESEPPERQVVTWLRQGDAPPEDERAFDQVTITLTPDGFGTVVDVLHVTHQDDAATLERAWTDLLAALVRLYDTTH